MSQQIILDRSISVISKMYVNWEMDLELEVFGQGERAGYCVRAVIVHVESCYVVVRVSDEELEEPCPLQPGDAVTGYFWRSGDAGYLFHTELLESRFVGQTYLLLRPPHELERHQRRLHVRVPYCETVSFLRIPAGSQAELLGTEVDESAIQQGNVEDLSAGGIRLRCWMALAVDDFVCISGFSLLPKQDVLFRVVTIDRLAEPGEPSDTDHEYGLSFVGLTARDRDRIT